MIRFVNFHKYYGAVTILRIKELVLPPGICWIKGANGAGKSTLLKAMAGIIDFEGDILLEEISIKRQPITFRRLVNFADAEPVFPEFLSGSEMIRLFASAKDAPPGQENHYLNAFRMTAWVNEPIGTYSSGMLKKLSIVLAFLGNPKVILLDEPLITIDADALSVLYRLIAERAKTDDVSFLLSSHQALDLTLFPAISVIDVAEQTAVLNPT